MEQHVTIIWNNTKQEEKEEGDKGTFKHTEFNASQALQKTLNVNKEVE
jgi:hypothetical protein